MNNSQKLGSSAESREKRSGLSTFKKITIVFVVSLAATVSMMTAASDSRVAYINDSGKLYTVNTVDTDTNGIIEEAGLVLGHSDEAIVTEESSERIDIDIIRAFPVKISCDGGTKIVEVTGGTVEDALKKANIEAAKNDFITPSLSSSLTGEANIEILRAVSINLSYAGNVKKVYVPQGRIADSLKYVGYRLTEEESLNIDKNAFVKEGMTVSVDKILTRTVGIKEKISPKIIAQPCDTLSLGEKKVKQEGKEGIVEIKYKEKYVNDVLVDKKQISRKVITGAVDKIVLVGTKEAVSSKPQAESSAAAVYAAGSSEAVTSEQPLTLYERGMEDVSSSADEVHEETLSSEPEEETSEQSDSGFGFTYSSMMVGTATAYTELAGITSTGTVPRVGTVAVNPAVIPYGTRLYICSADGSYVYGYAIAEDTGTAAMAGDILVDLYMNTEEECEAFGRQQLCVYILD